MFSVTHRDGLWIMHFTCGSHDAQTLAMTASWLQMVQISFCYRFVTRLLVLSGLPLHTRWDKLGWSYDSQRLDSYIHPSPSVWVKLIWVERKWESSVTWRHWCVGWVKTGTRSRLNSSYQRIPQTQEWSMSRRSRISSLFVCSAPLLHRRSKQLIVSFCLEKSYQ